MKKMLLLIVGAIAAAIVLFFAPDGINKRAALIKMQSVCAAWRTLQIKKLLNRSMGQAIQQLLLLQQTQI